MCRRVACLSWIGLMLLAGPRWSVFAAEAPAGDLNAAAHVALSWRLDQVSSAALGPQQPAAAWRRAAAILEQAAHLNPREPRFQRLRALALRHVGDTDGAIKALNDYRATSPAASADRVAQAQLIDLYATRLETADAKLSYLEGLLGHENIPVEVRAHVAEQCVMLLNQKSPEQAAEMAKRAVSLYPLPEATRQYYELVARHQPLPQQLAGLLALLKANPNQPTYVTEVAHLLASNGLAAASLQWYDLAVLLITNNGPDRPSWTHELLIDYASELILTDHTAPADTLVGQMLDADPLDADAWFLKLTLAKGSSEEVTYGQTLELARNSLARKWNLLHEEAVTGHAPEKPPEQAAGPVQPADPAPVVQKIQADKDPRETDRFVNTVGDLAWFELYYDRQPELARRWIDALRAVTPADSTLLQRLEGWYALMSNRPQQARTIFSKISDQDPLAALGIIRADEVEKKPVDPGVRRKLLDEQRTGMLAAMLSEALRPEKSNAATQPASSQPATSQPTTQNVAQLDEELQKFPARFLAVLDPRRAPLVYVLHGEPLKPNVAYGDPILVRVTLDNRSDFDMTIGPGCLIRPELWLDAQTIGLDQQSFSGVAYDQLCNQLVLRAQTSMSQTVRLDEGKLRQAIELSPGTTTRIGGDVVTNPIPVRDGVAPGAGGEINHYARTVVYSGVPLTEPRGAKMLDAALAANSPLDRLAALDLMAGYVQLARDPKADPSLRQPATEYVQDISRLRTDPSPPVAAWASYLLATLYGGDQQDRVITEMTESKDPTTRLLALFAAQALPPARQKQLASDLLQGDQDPVVKEAAAAALELASDAATRPTTQPATEPAAPASQPLGPAGF